MCFMIRVFDNLYLVSLHCVQAIPIKNEEWCHSVYSVCVHACGLLKVKISPIAALLKQELL